MGIGERRSGWRGAERAAAGGCGGAAGLRAESAPVSGCVARMSGSYRAGKGRRAVAE